MTTLLGFLPSLGPVANGRPLFETQRLTFPRAIDAKKAARLKQSIYPSVTLQGAPILGRLSLEAHMKSNWTLTRIEILLLVTAVTLMAVTVSGTVLFR
jgi:hypothetical protein